MKSHENLPVKKPETGGFQGVLGSVCFLGLQIHPPKINMEPENGGPLEKEIPIGFTIISRFQPLIFWGVYLLPSRVSVFGSQTGICK